MNLHKFNSKEYGRLSKYLIRNYEVASVEYPQQESKEADESWQLPIGLERHDVYIIRQDKINELNGKLKSNKETPFIQN